MWNVAQKGKGNFYTSSNCILVYKMYNKDKQKPENHPQRPVRCPKAC